MTPACRTSLHFGLDIVWVVVGCLPEEARLGGADGSGEGLVEGGASPEQCAVVSSGRSRMVARSCKRVVMEGRLGMREVESNGVIA
jgi:hypothetical protein